MDLQIISQKSEVITLRSKLRRLQVELDSLRNQAIDDDAIVIDMRNRYESEVGKFENAITPDIDRSEELLPTVKKLLQGHQNDKIIMYCTGGIRCEKASSYLIKNGFKDVNQLKGGIIQYSHDIKNSKEKSKFIGKNFVFDFRMGEIRDMDNLRYCMRFNLGFEKINEDSYHSDYKIPDRSKK